MLARRVSASREPYPSRRRGRRASRRAASAAVRRALRRCAGSELSPAAGRAECRARASVAPRDGRAGRGGAAPVAAGAAGATVAAGRRGRGGRQRSSRAAGGRRQRALPACSCGWQRARVAGELHQRRREHAQRDRDHEHQRRSPAPSSWARPRAACARRRRSAGTTPGRGAAARRTAGRRLERPAGGAPDRRVRRALRAAWRSRPGRRRADDLGRFLAARLPPRCPRRAASPLWPGAGPAGWGSDPAAGAASRCSAAVTGALARERSGGLRAAPAAARGAGGCGRSRLGRRLRGWARRERGGAAPGLGRARLGRQAAGRGARDRQVGVPAHRQAAVRAEAVFAAVDRGAARAGGYPGLAQHGDRLGARAAPLDRAQLAVDLAERVQLGEHQRVVALAEAVQVEDEAAEVAVGELAGPAQETRPPSGAPARAEAGLAVGRVGSPAASAPGLPVAGPACAGGSAGFVPDV